MSAQKCADITASVGSYEGTHQNCQRWQFYGHFSDRPRRTANLGSSTDTFQPNQHLRKYPSLQNCQRWQFYGHFSARPFITANLSSSTDTFQPHLFLCFQNCQPWQLYGHFSAQKSKCPHNCQRWQLWWHLQHFGVVGVKTKNKCWAGRATLKIFIGLVWLGVWLGLWVGFGIRFG